MYETGETSYLDFLLSSETLVDFISSYYLISEVTDYDTKMLEQLDAHKKKIEAEKKNLEDDKKELSNSKTTLISKQQGLKVMKKSKEEYAAELTGKEKQLEEELSELASHEQSINRRIIELQRQYDEEQARKRGTSGGILEPDMEYQEECGAQDTIQELIFQYQVEHQYMQLEMGKL